MQKSKFVEKAVGVLQKSVDKMADFLKQTYDKDTSHNPWIERATNAYKAGCPLESILICTNLINSKIRLGIYWNTVVNMAREYGILIGDEYLLELLTNPENELLGKIDDRKIYNEAYKIKLIDSKIKGKLHDLYNRRNGITHNLFHTKKTAEPSEEEFKLARDYLEITMECIQSMIKKVEDIATECQKIIESVDENVN